jgi:hypothetical protein
MHENFSYDLIAWNLVPQRKNINYGNHVTPKEVSTSTNLNICNILLHGKTNIAKIERQFCFFQIFSCVIILLIDYVVKFPCVQ